MTVARLDVRRRAVALVSGRAVASALAALWFVLASRRLGPESTGELALVLTLGLIASVSAEFGLGTLLTTAVAESPESARQLAIAVLIRRTLTAVLASAAMTLLYLLASSAADLRVPLVFSLSVIASPVYGSVHAAMRGLGQVTWEVWNEVIARSVVLVVGLFAVTDPGDLLLAVSLYAAVDMVSALVHLPVLRRLPSSDARIATSIDIRRIWPLGVSAAMQAVFQRIDVWLVGLLLGSQITGVYAASRRLVDGQSLGPQTIGVLSIAEIAKAPAGGERLRLLRRLQGWAVVLAAVAGVVLLLAPEGVLRIVYGEAFISGAAELRVLAGGAVLSAAAWPALGGLVVGSPRHAAFWTTIGCGALMAAVSAGVIIAGSIGAAVAVACVSAVAAPVVASVAARQLDHRSSTSRR